MTILNHTAKRIAWLCAWSFILGAFAPDLKAGIIITTVKDELEHLELSISWDNVADTQTATLTNWEFTLDIQGPAGLLNIWTVTGSARHKTDPHAGEVGGGEMLTATFTFPDILQTFGGTLTSPKQSKKHATHVDTFFGTVKRDAKGKTDMKFFGDHVPEPASWLLTGPILAMMVGLARRRLRKGC